MVLGRLVTILGRLVTVLGREVTVIGWLVTVVGRLVKVVGRIVTVFGWLVTVLGRLVTVVGRPWEASTRYCAALTRRKLGANSAQTRRKLCGSESFFIAENLMLGNNRWAFTKYGRKRRHAPEAE